ncbi:hypothetical protein, partial [Segatella paludivivens]
LNVLPSAAEFYAKVLVFFHACNEIMYAVLAKVILPYVLLVDYLQNKTVQTTINRLFGLLLH